MIGRSLSLCIQDMIEHNSKFSKNDVEFLVVSTMIETSETFEKVICTYKELYWHINPELGEQLAWHFWNKGLIFQPRLYDTTLSQDLSDNKLWVNKIEECLYIS